VAGESQFTAEVQAEVCELLRSGDYSLREIAAIKGFSASLILYHAENNKEFAEHYARALNIGIDVGFERLDDDVKEEPRLIDTKFGTMIDPAWVQLQRLKIDTKKWSLSKRKPKVYGEKLDMNVSGSLDLASRLSAARDRKK
jgi:hypothetical protein